ncbi:hypothetical protein FOXG_22744 [Fusarium oxysporum f. sp. lycopersici 4287]|uniref:Uncharacterized protein n=1 Tax=Fusarium oxysporum f. sp. lycopersici (strain 4287 / CBS 123668 / FGSC 9935 / NRRL 34936) TaxID=426428 RepID=A0A0J9WC20_FUSO4|nr:hypothetical protein FOXG_22744 [Fusarium oxysporum f. sp. lycopersici 4287]KNB20076.1 hypothetical protein FOXG_22744 [Fusarium oxysporum f. sp. lycopersici 4287]
MSDRTFGVTLWAYSLAQLYQELSRKRFPGESSSGLVPAPRALTSLDSSFSSRKPVVCGIKILSQLSRDRSKAATTMPN